MTQRRDILLVGSYPPPVGGVSVHVQRLADRAVSEGLSVAVASPYPIQGNVAVAGYTVFGGYGSGLWRYLACCRAIRIVRARVVHFHASGLTRLVPIALLRALVPLRARTILTIHSGSWPSAEHGLGVRRRLETWLLSQFSTVIAVNAIQVLRLREMLGATSEVLLIPAFIRAEKGRLRTDTETITAGARLAKRAVILLSGFGTPLYRYEDLFAALRVSGAVEDVEVILALYNTVDRDYLSRLGEAGQGIRWHMVRDLAPSQFLALLEEVDLYVRSAGRDGDSVAVREAQAAGIPVVASDVAPRPVGTLVYPFGDVDAFATILSRALSGNCHGIAMPDDSHVDCWVRMKQVYGGAPPVQY